MQYKDLKDFAEAEGLIPTLKPLDDMSGGMTQMKTPGVY